MFSCNTCNKTFARKYNLVRHKQRKHQQETDDVDFESDTFNGEEESDPMDRLVEEVFEQYQDRYEEEVKGLMYQQNITEEEARDRTFNLMKNTYRKALTNIFTENVIWINALKDSPVFQSIKKTADSVIQTEDFDTEEAWKYAVNKRKFLFEAVIEGYNPPELTQE
jgi:hypothetical protein